MSTSDFLLASFAKFRSVQECQTLTVNMFNKAMEDEDYDIAVDVAEFVIGSNEMPRHDYSAGFQMHCLNWLSRHYHKLYGESEDDSEEEELYLSKLFDVLWKFKWIVARLPYDINMTLEEISQANELMGNLYEHFSLGKSALAKTLMHQSIKMGDVQAAKQHFQDWQSSKNADDFIDDCDACEQNSLVEYHHFIGDYRRVLELAKPILSGKMTCGEVPHTTYQYVIDSLVHLNQMEKAQDVLEQAIALITENTDDFLSLLSPLIYLASKAGQPHLAKDLLDEFNDDIVAFVPNNRLYYLEYLHAVAPFNDEGLTEAKKVAAQFDERNGNTHYQDKLALMFGNTMIH